jgi:hypothetical protein
VRKPNSSYPATDLAEWPNKTNVYGSDRSNPSGENLPALDRFMGMAIPKVIGALGILAKRTE